jgi:hypothetical protein
MGRTNIPVIVSSSCNAPDDNAVADSAGGRGSRAEQAGFRHGALREAKVGQERRLPATLIGSLVP